MSQLVRDNREHWKETGSEKTTQLTVKNLVYFIKKKKVTHIKFEINEERITERN